MSFLNRQNHFIYVHIPKTAGVSLTRALYATGLKNDLNIGIGSRSNLLSSRVLKRLPWIPVPKTPGLGRLKMLELVHSGHLSIEDFSRNLDSFHDYSAFAIVRNPFAWLVSMYTFVNSVKNHPYQKLNPDRFATFENFIRYHCEYPGSQLGFVRNSVGRVDNVTLFKLEKVTDNYADLSAIVGVELAELKRYNISNNRHYSEFYTRPLRDMVEKAYRSDLEDLEYDFEIS